MHIHTDACMPPVGSAKQSAVSMAEPVQPWRGLGPGPVQARAWLRRRGPAGYKVLPAAGMCMWMHVHVNSFVSQSLSNGTQKYIYNFTFTMRF